tara:strand:- start:2 stop:505 length:504 start_codon:yes stop_codon:yes gene_type:complete
MFYIYRLTDGEQDYYGQTEDYEKRLKFHKYPSAKMTMSRLLNKNNMKLHVLHTLFTKQEADETEQFYILNMECVNNNVPLRTKKEWDQDNKEKISEYKKEYYQDNKEKISEYYQENKEKIHEYKKEWYQNNKEKYNQKFNCECGGKYTDSNKSRHFKTKNHKNYISR